jgi:hypothetical protein
MTTDTAILMLIAELQAQIMQLRAQIAELRQEGN